MHKELNNYQVDVLNYIRVNPLTTSKDIFRNLNYTLSKVRDVVFQLERRKLIESYYAIGNLNRKIYKLTGVAKDE